MSRIKCIIIEDEPLSQDVLISYITDLQEIELVKVFDDAISASREIRSLRPDLIFLDINMPGMSGLHFLKSIPDPPLIIFTTAYPEYAIEGFEVDAIDYLLKPFPFERFLKAVNKAVEKMMASGREGFQEKTIWLKADKKVHQTELSSILYLEACGDYVKVVTSKEKLLVHDTLARLLDILPGEEFIRIHRSYVISLQKIRYIEGNQIAVGDEILPMGQVYREDFMKLLNKE